MQRWSIWTKAVSLGISALALPFACAQEMPRLAVEQGRATLIVDGKPFWLLGAQVDNSSGWPERLQAVWPAAEAMRLNTLEVPVYWEQMEPEKGRFDFTVVDAVVKQSREHKVRLVLLWFGTWKNGKMHYVPEWVKSDTATYPRMKTRDGRADRCAEPERSGKPCGGPRCLCGADAAPARNRCTAYRDHDAGGERIGIFGHGAGLWCGGSEGVRRAGAGRACCAG